MTTLTPFDAAVAALPPAVRQIEELVHGQGVAPEWLALRLRIPVADIRQHLEVARRLRVRLAAAMEERRLREVSAREAVAAAVRDAGQDAAAAVAREAHRERVRARALRERGDEDAVRRRAAREEAVRLARAGASPAEIALATGLPAGQVSTLLHQARGAGEQVPCTRPGPWGRRGLGAREAADMAVGGASVDDVAAATGWQRSTVLQELSAARRKGAAIPALGLAGRRGRPGPRRGPPRWPRCPRRSWPPRPR